MLNLERIVPWAEMPLVMQWMKQSTDSYFHSASPIFSVLERRLTVEVWDTNAEHQRITRSCVTALLLSGVRRRLTGLTREIQDHWERSKQLQKQFSLWFLVLKEARDPMESRLQSLESANPDFIPNTTAVSTSPRNGTLNQPTWTFLISTVRSPLMGWPLSPRGRLPKPKTIHSF